MLKEKKQIKNTRLFHSKMKKSRSTEGVSELEFFSNCIESTF